MKYFVCLLLAVTSMFAWAETWSPKTKSIEIVVPYPPGGATDKLARIVDKIFQEHGWKSHVVNRAGANGVIGGNFAAKAKPDGYTVFMSGTGLLDANIVYKSSGIEYDEKSFTPIVPVGNVSFVLAVKKGMPIDTYEKFKFYVKANPDRFNVAFWNANTANVFTEWARVEGLPIPNIVLYKGSGPQVIDLLGGHVDFAWDTWVAVAPQFDAGKINVIATLDDQGADVIRQIKPGSPVVSVAKNHPQLGIGVWYGLWAPAGTPKDIIKEMNQVVNNGLKKPANRQAIEAMYVKKYGGTAKSLEQLQSRNFETIKKLSNEK
jgi:tripartite-type tricarboxylate transporter receptor subunit TctC